MVFKIRTLSLPIPRTKEDLLVIHGCPLKTFSLRELKLATDSFSKKNIVDRGGFGCVYRGRLDDGSFVAIKRLKKERTPGGELQFQTEVDMGGSPASNHRNVLRLLGYCMTRKERILVYPFIVNRCVSSWLRGRDPSEPPLDWSTRKRIALGTVKGLAHLHYGSSFTVIHRDIKAANILLDEQFEAILCDFGLAKFVGRNGNESNSARVQRAREEHYNDEDLFEEEDESDQENNCFTKSCWNFTRAEDRESRSRIHTKWSCWVFTKNEVISENNDEFCSHVTTAVRGTMGYMDPDYYYTNQCSVKSDVYGYGVTLLELVTGQRVYDPARLENDKHVVLLDWVKGLLEDLKLDLLVDYDIRGDCIQEELQQLIRLALSCTDDDPKKRPVMTEVIKIVENIGNDAAGYAGVASDPLNWVYFESSHEMEAEVLQEVNVVQCESNQETEPARAEFLPQVLAVGINNNPQHDFQFKIATSGGFSLSLKCSNLFVCCVILLIPIFANLVSRWVWDRARY